MNFNELLTTIMANLPLFFFCVVFVIVGIVILVQSVIRGKQYRAIVTNVNRRFNGDGYEYVLGFELLDRYGNIYSDNRINLEGNAITAEDSVVYTSSRKRVGDTIWVTRASNGTWSYGTRKTALLAAILFIVVGIFAFVAFTSNGGA